MPEVVVNSPNINTFKFSASFDLYNKSILYNSSGTDYVSGGQLLVKGISFRIEDKEGVVYKDYDFTNPDINPAGGGSTYTLDLSSFGLPFLLGNTFKITGGIKDSNDAIYYTPAVFKTLCKPVGITEAGYVPGMFQVIASCANNTLTVKEISLLVYDGKQPTTVSKDGTLYYPTGTLAPVPFTGTPFTNNEIITGENRINCTTVATYDMSDDVFVLVTYLTKQVFPVSCNFKMMDLMCCLEKLEQTAITQCDTAVGQGARQKMNDISFYFMVGLGKETNGQDASKEAEYIRKALNCDCGAFTLGQNEQTPLNPAVTNIVLQGVAGTTIPDATVNGSTKTYLIASSIYQVVKGNTSDLAFSIITDTSTPNLVKYKITFNYDVMAGYILTAIQNNPTWIALLNSLITGISSGVTGLNGKCVINTASVDYAVSESVTGSTLITNIVINGVTYNAPANTHANDTATINLWLNSLSLGVFNASLASGTLTIISTANTNVVSTITFTSPNETKLFGSSSKTLLQVLQGIIDYLCGLTACQIALCHNLSLLYFDYNGVLTSLNVTTSNTQDDYNTALSSVINNLAARINTLTGITCDKLKAVFVDRPSSSFAGVARIFGYDTDGNCIAWSPQQVSLGVMQAVQAFANVKTAFCDIDCTTPATCPDIAGINMNIISGNIGIYGVTFSPAASGSQQLTVQYRIHGTTTWTTATNNLSVFANGNINGTTPYQISGLTQGTTYDVQIVNNCGGSGFISQITVPTGAVYSGSFLLGNVLYTLCGQAPVTLYSSSPFGSGVTMYTDAGLTTPVTGNLFISGASSGNIFQLNASTGVVGIDTGNSCSSGIAGSYILGNSTGTICAGASQTLYTNGSFAPAKILYSDPGLTTPVTGFSFVVNSADNHIYNLNSSTGVIGSDTGLTCTLNYRLNAAAGRSIDSVSGTGIPVLPPTGINGSQQGFQTGMSGSYGFSISGSSVEGFKLTAYVNGSPVSCILLAGPGVYNLTITASSAQSVVVSIESGSC